MSYTSAGTFLGHPWIDVQHGEASSDGSVAQPQTARGWIAVGDHAHGLLLGVGNRARGLIAVGGFCIGGVTIGGFGLGIISLCGVSIGLFSFGGLAIGFFAFGGLALGMNALGGAAFGVRAFGGAALGWRYAEGGLAWSNGVANGGVVLSGKPPSTETESHWFTKLARESMDFSVVVESYPLGSKIAFTLGAIALVVIILATIWYKRVFLPGKTQGLAEQTVSRERAVDPRKMLRNDHGAFCGSLLGCTVWMVGLVADARRIDQIALPAAIYVLGLIVCGVLFWMQRKDRDGLFTQLMSCAIMALSLCLVLSLPRSGNGTEGIPALSRPVSFLTLGLILILHAGIALLMAKSRRLQATECQASHASD